MRKKVTAGMALLLAAAFLVLAGCPQEVEIPSGDTGLNSITINGVSVPVPQGVDRDTWLDSGFPASSMDVTEALLPSDAFNTAVSVNVDVKGADATVWYLKVSGGLVPAADDPNWTDTATFTFKERDSLYIQVTSADKSSQSYYWVRLNKISTDSGVFALMIAGRNVGVLESMGADAIAQVDMKGITLAFEKETNNVPVKAIPKDPLATVQYGFLKATDTSTEPQWGDIANFTFDDGDKVYVKVTPSGPNAASRYYGAVVNNTTYLRVSAVNIGGVNQAISANGSSIDVTRTIQTVNGVLMATAADGVTVEYDLLPAEGTPVYEAIPENTSATGTPLTYTDGSVLYLRATVAGYNPVYYKFNIALKSNDRTITSITIGGTSVTSNGTGANAITGGTWGWMWGANGTATIPNTGASGPVVVTFTDSGARVTGFQVLATTATPNVNDLITTGLPGTTFNLAPAITSGQRLIIRVQAPDGATVWYHGIDVTVTP
jgi:hypothetical protein